LSPAWVLVTRTTLSKYDVGVVIVEDAAAGSRRVSNLIDDAIGPPIASSGGFSEWLTRSNHFPGPPLSIDRQEALKELGEGMFDVTPPPPTEVLLPHGGQVLRGEALLDAAVRGDLHPTRVEFHLIAGVRDINLGPARLTIGGWVLPWKTTSVTNGTYEIESVVSGHFGAVRSDPVRVAIDNP
jgi:hypothetical protein